MKIEYCSIYKNAKDNQLYIPMVHNNDVNLVICLKVFLNNPGGDKYLEIFDPYYVDMYKLYTIDISNLEGPTLNKEGEELSIPIKIRGKVYYSIWEHQLDIIKKNYRSDYRGESIKFLMWTNFKYILDASKKISKEILDKENNPIVKNKCIYWIEFGHNIGVELRKERPAIIWRKFKGDNRFFVIPITSRSKNENTYVKIDSINKYASLEHMKLVSVKRIRRPFFDNDRKIKKLSEEEIALLNNKLSSFLIEKKE